jgi:hypothetical protein
LKRLLVAGRFSLQTHTLAMVAGSLFWQTKDLPHFWHYTQRFIANLAERKSDRNHRRQSQQSRLTLGLGFSD